MPDLLAALQPYVASLMAYDVDLGAPGVHRGLPSTTVTFVLPCDEPLEVGWKDVPDSRTTGWSSVSGLHDRPADIHHRGHQRGVQLALTPAGALGLLGLPAGQLAGRLLTLEETVPSLRHLPEQLAETPHDKRRDLVARTVAQELARRGAPRVRAEVSRAVAGLTRGFSVQAVADDVGYSRRHLTSLVRAETGLAPQQVRRIARFEAAHRIIGHLPLAEVAATCGYADQAHLSREWSALAGCTPTTWLREEFPFFQDRRGSAAAQ